LGNDPIDDSPYHVLVKAMHPADASKVRTIGPGLMPSTVLVNKQTHFDLLTDGAGVGKPDVVIVDPTGSQDAVLPTIRSIDDSNYRVEYIPILIGMHSINVFYEQSHIIGSPFGVYVDSPKVVMVINYKLTLSTYLARSRETIK
jgi:filamin